MNTHYNRTLQSEIELEAVDWFSATNYDGSPRFVLIDNDIYQVAVEKDIPAFKLSTRAAIYEIEKAAENVYNRRYLEPVGYENSPLLYNKTLQRVKAFMKCTGQQSANYKNPSVKMA